MATRSVWEQAWNSAQPRLTAIRDSLNLHSSTDPRVIRVGQLDSELLDQDLAHILQEPLTKAFALIDPSWKGRFEPEIGLLIQAVLYKLSIWDSGASYGAKLQDLRYVVPSTAGKRLAPSGLPRRILVIHAALTVVLPYLHNKLRSHALSHAWPDAPSSDRRRKAWDLLTSLESTYTLLGLVSFVAFLWDGRYRTISDRLLQMTLVPSRRLVKRDVSYEFMNRQMVWHAFTEFLLFLLPLINARSVKRRLARILTFLSPSHISNLISSSRTSSQSTSSTKKQKRGKFWSLPQDQCGICAENASYNLNLSDPTNAFTAFAEAPHRPSSPTQPDESSADVDIEPPAYPIYTPYVTSCGHMYCYHCIAERMIRAADEGDGTGWECLRCSEIVTASERYVVEAGSEVSSSDYNFSSSDLASDISGSIGSYSYSGNSEA